MGTKVKHQYAPTMRKALYEGLLKAAKDQGMTLSDYCATWWKEDWKGAARALAGFTPKEVESTVTGKVSHDHQHHHTHAGMDHTMQFIDSVLGTEAEETKH